MMPFVLYITCYAVFLSCFKPKAFADIHNDLNNGLTNANVAEHKYQSRAVVHIGPHKTGTTFIQEMLCEHEVQLGKLGWVVPTCPSCGGCFSKQFAGLALELRGDIQKKKWRSCGVKPSTCFAERLERLHANESIVLSSEAFDSLDRVGIERLAVLLAGLRVEIVFFLRHKISLLSSYYTQVHKRWQRADSLQEWLFQLSGSKQNVGGLHTQRLLSLYASVFGPRSIWVFSYEGTLHHQLSPFSAILLDVLRVNIDVSSRRQWSNVGESSLLFSTVLFLQDHLHPYHPSRKVFRECLKNVAGKLIADGMVATSCSDLTYLNLVNENSTQLARSIQGVNLKYFSDINEADGAVLCDVDRNLYREVPEALFELVRTATKSFEICLNA